MTFERVIVEAAYELALALPTTTATAVASAILTCSPKSLAAEITKRVAHHQHRTLAQDFISRWHAEAPDLDARTVAVALHSAIHTLDSHRAKQSVELVWTGPDTENQPFRRTEQAILQVLDSAVHRITLVSYASLPHPQHRRCVGSRRPSRGQIDGRRRDPRQDQRRRRVQHASGPRLRSRRLLHRLLLAQEKENRPLGPNDKVGILHVKCAVADSKWLFLSSANLTQQAFTINMELGMLVRGGPMPKQVEELFAQLIAMGQLRSV